MPSANYSQPPKYFDVLVLLPLIWIIIAIIYFMTYLISSTPGANDAPFYGLFFLLHFCITLLTFFLGGWSIHRLYTRTNLPSREKSFYVIAILLVHVFSIPYIYFKYLKKVS